MILSFTKRAEKDYKKLQRVLQGKADKQFAFLIENYRHPSLEKPDFQRCSATNTHPKEKTCNSLFMYSKILV